jgi:hypothetical protein
MGRLPITQAIGVRIAGAAEVVPGLSSPHSDSSVGMLAGGAERTADFLVRLPLAAW